MRRGLVGLAVAVAIGCSGSGELPNQLPTASLVVAPEQSWKGEALVLDASGSTDPDGTIIAYRFIVPDGSADVLGAAPIVEHRFGRGGRYQVAVIVTDDRDGQARADAFVTVLEEPRPGGCLADDECRADEQCLDGRCSPAPECGDGTACEAPLECVGGYCHCPSGTALCGDSCLSLGTDEENCGTCGHVCPAWHTCEDGVCMPPVDCGALTLCGTTCVDVTSDVEHCGRCDNECLPAGAVCLNGSCAGPCWEGASLCPDGLCYDLDTDPFNCGGCGLFCDTYACAGGTCLAGPPGTVLETFPVPPFETVTGLSHDEEGFHVIADGRRVVTYDPTTGATADEFVIDNDDDRRAFGLAIDGERNFILGVQDLWTTSTAADFEAYTTEGLFDMRYEIFGGASTSDGINIFTLRRYELTTRASGTYMPLGSEKEISGLFATYGDRRQASDIALDGHGMFWAVGLRAGGFPAFMKKFDVDAGMVVLDVPPPDPDGLTGVVLVGEDLWGVGPNGFYRMVP